MKLALAQISITTADIDENVDRAITAIETAAANDADCIALPEIFNVGYFAFDAYARHAEPLGGDTHARIRDAAIANNVTVVAGTIVEDLAASAAAGETVPRPDGYANTAAVFDPDGQRCLVYRKHHLFGYHSAEAELLVPGEHLHTVDLYGHTIGVTTCYDLRFPELYRRLLDAGVTAVIVPSAWPYPRVEHWQILPRARAIENLIYVGAINGAGAINQTSLVGRSTIYGPWGTPLAASDDDPAVVYAECDPGHVAAVREDFPAIQDRR